MANKKKYVFFNIDVTVLFTRLEELAKDEKNGIDFNKMLKDIEDAQKKKNFDVLFKDIVSKNLDKVLVAQAKAIKDGKSDVSLAKMCKNFINTMQSIEKICIDKRILEKDVLSSVFDEKKLKDKMTEIVKRELMSTDKKEQKKLDDELKEITSFKVDNTVTAKQTNKPLETIKKTILDIAEKKYGPTNENNKEDIKKYVEEFDITKPEFEDDFKKFGDKQYLVRNTLGFIIDPKTGLPYITDLYYQYFLAHGRGSMLDVYMGFDKLKSTKNNDSKSSSIEEYVNKRWYDRYCNMYYHKPLDRTETFDKGLPYAKELENFKNHFGFNVNYDLIKDMLHDTESCEKGKDVFYRRAYLDTFIRLFEKTDGGYKKMCQLAYDYEDLMQAMMKEEAPSLKGPEFKYGGMSVDEYKKFLITLADTQCNLTQKCKKEIEINCKKADVLPVKDTIKFSKDKIEEVNKKEDISKEEKLANSIAMLSALQQIHNERASGFSFFHPILYKEETRAINDLKKEIMELSGAKMTKEMEESLNTGKDLYAEGYQDALKSIDGFTMDEREKQPLENLGKETEIENSKVPVSEKKIDDPSLDKTIVKKQPELPDLNKKKND